MILNLSKQSVQASYLNKNEADTSCFVVLLFIVIIIQNFRLIFVYIFYFFTKRRDYFSDKLSIKIKTSSAASIIVLKLFGTFRIFCVVSSRKIIQGIYVYFAQKVKHCLLTTMVRVRYQTSGKESVVYSFHFSSMWSCFFLTKKLYIQLKLFLCPKV